jgi:hypothetical protein
MYFDRTARKAAHGNPSRASENGGLSQCSFECFESLVGHSMGTGEIASALLKLGA